MGVLLYNEAEAAAAAAAAAGEGGDGDGAGLSAAGCESAEDCEGEDQICATTDIDSVDEAHADYDADEYALVEGLFPLSVCITQEECDTAVADAEAEDLPYTLSVSCGATKLVASFAALALASYI